MVKLREEKPVVVNLNETPWTALARKRWPWADNSVDEASAVNVLQYLNPGERIHFVNELHRVLKASGKCQLVTPHWACNRAYGDLAFQWPPIVEQWFFHLNKEWREKNNPTEERYRCDFDPTWGYGMHPALVSRNPEYQQHAITFWKEAAQDLVVTVTKR